MPRLRRAAIDTPGITRRRAGKGWCYYASNGERLNDPDVLSRITGLVIPPAWTDVWICEHANGHIQAVGTDAAGRRQYLYHPHWHEQRAKAKFDHVLEFAERLPAARERLVETLESTSELTRDRVLAAAVRLLDLGFFRIGSEQYAEQNNTYGLATMLKEHVTIQSGTITFDYPAKHGKQRVQSVADDLVCDVVVALKRRRSGGPELLAYRDGRRWVDVHSDDVNEYLKAVVGWDCSAKDFRTWSATVLAAVALAVSTRMSQSPTARKRAVARAVREVSEYLGNTPAVCRSSYIDPRVVDLYADGITIVEDLDRLGADVGYGELATQGAVEAAVLAMLRDPAAARRRVRKAA